MYIYIYIYVEEEREKNKITLLLNSTRSFVRSIDQSILYYYYVSLVSLLTVTLVTRTIFSFWAQTNICVIGLLLWLNHSTQIGVIGAIGPTS
jgi:hypothetical protein